MLRFSLDIILGAFPPIPQKAILFITVGTYKSVLKKNLRA